MPSRTAGLAVKAPALHVPFPMDKAVQAASLYALLRCVVLCTGVPAALQSVIELSTPVTSFPRLEEGWYLYNVARTSPYEGAVFHQSPLLLVLFSCVPKLAWPAVFVGADLLGALSLASFASTSPTFSPVVITLLYLLNPFSLLSSIAQSTNVLTNALICAAVAAAAHRRAGRAMAAMAGATMLSWYPLYLVPSIIALSRAHAHPTSWTKHVAVLVLTLVGLLGVAYLPLLSFQFITNQFGTLFLLKDLTQPNIGLWWYFFIEMFEEFRPFFVGAFQLFLLAFPVPVLIRFPTQPLFGLATIVGVLAVFKPYPEASDLGLFLTLLVLNKQVFDLMDYRFFEVLGLVYAAVLGPVFYYLWIFVGSGNSNFYYAITLVYAISMILVLSDSMWSAVRIDYDGGKSQKLTQI